MVIRDSFPAGEFHDLPRQWAGMDDLPFEERVKVMARFIESWEFDGDPDNAKTWLEMDAFREVMIIQRYINQFVVGLIADAKN